MKKYRVTFEIKKEIAILTTTIKQWKVKHEEIIEADSFYEAKQIVKAKHKNAINMKAELIK